MNFLKLSLLKSQRVFANDDLGTMHDQENTYDKDFIQCNNKAFRTYLLDNHFRNLKTRHYRMQGRSFSDVNYSIYSTPLFYALGGVQFSATICR